MKEWSYLKELDLKKSAFTLVEILIVMVVIGAMATIIIPRLFRKEPRADFNFVLNELNDLVYFARQEAIATQKNYRLYFQSNKNAPDFITVEQEQDDPEKPDKTIFKQVYSDYLQTRYDLHPSVKMIHFYQGKKEQFEENKGRAYCYVVPSGLVQDVIVHMSRIRDDNTEFKGTFKVEPFLGKFEFYEGFVYRARD